MRRLWVGIFLATSMPALPASAGSLLSDVAVTIRAEYETLYAGQVQRYVARVTNNGPLDAEDVRVSLSFPAGATVASFFTNQGTCEQSNSTLTCALGTIPAFATVLLDARGTLIAAGDAVATIDVLDSGNLDLFTDNDRATHTTPVAPSADLFPTLEWSSETGTGTVVGLTVLNAGPSSATGVVAEISTGDPYLLGSAFDQNGNPCEATTATSAVCSLGNVDANDGHQITVEIRPPYSGLMVTIGVSAAEHDPDPANNTRGWRALTRAKGDLAVQSLSATPDPVRLGRLLTYTASIANFGPSPAEGAVATNELPAQVTFVSASATQGTCSASGRTVTCNLGNVPEGQPVDITIVVRVRETGFLVDTMTLTALVEDPVPENNTMSTGTYAVRKP